MRGPLVGMKCGGCSEIGETEPQHSNSISSGSV